MDTSSYVGTLFYQIVSTSSDIVSELAEYDDEPAIFQGLAPHDVIEPYMTFTETSVPEENPMVDRITITIDIFDESGSPGLVKRMAANIQKLFDQMRGGLILGMWRDYAGMVVEDSPNIQHYSMILTARFLRRDLTELQIEE